MLDFTYASDLARRRLSGKVALVTGGSRGIGAAIAAELAHEGASVLIGCHHSCEEAERLADELVGNGLDAMPCVVDTTSPDDLKAALAVIVDRWGGLDILVNNAGISKVARLEDVTDQLLEQMIAVNVTGVYLAIREALPHLRSGGRVVNIGSISSDFMPYVGNSLYTMTKSAVSGLTRGLARELAERRITINNVQPGRVETDLLRDALGGRYEQAREQTPLGRFGAASEVAHVVTFLCSDDAGYVTGANLRVDGGVSV